MSIISILGRAAIVIGLFAQFGGTHAAQSAPLQRVTGGQGASELGAVNAIRSPVEKRKILAKAGLLVSNPKGMRSHASEKLLESAVTASSVGCDLIAPECTTGNEDDYFIYDIGGYDAQWIVDVSDCPPGYDGWVCVRGKSLRSYNVLCRGNGCSNFTLAEVGEGKATGAVPMGLYNDLYDMIAGEIQKVVFACNGLPKNSTGTNATSHSEDAVRSAAANAIIRSTAPSVAALFRLHKETLTVVFSDGGREQYMFNTYSAAQKKIEGTLMLGDGISKCPSN